MSDAAKKHYSMTGGPKGAPVIGMMLEATRDPIGVLSRNSLRYGDIIPFHVMGKKAVQINHPELVRYVLMENHKNYYKSDIYIRFESVLGQGLLTSNGNKWRRDRQKIQPMFKREQVEGYYFDVINDVGEKFKRLWLERTQNGPAQIDITREMANITIEVILRSIFGKDNLDDATIESIHNSFIIFIDYLKDMRLLPKVDLHKLFRTPRYKQFHGALMKLEATIKGLLDQYRKGTLTDKYNMLALLFEAQKQNLEHVSDQDIMDHALTMVFGGFESTSILMQWMWYVLGTRPDVEAKLRDDIVTHAPSTLTHDSAALTFAEVSKMGYLEAFFKETMRLYPPFWVSSRKPIAADYLGDYKIESGTVVVVPQIVMHRHPRWWSEPDAFIPERFFPESEANIDLGLYFPFSQGPRKCMGYRLVEIEAQIIFSKLVPLFKVKPLNMLGNVVDPGISLKLKHPLIAEISRV